MHTRVLPRTAALALAVSLAAGTGSILAEPAATLYGVINVSVDHLDTGDDSAFNVSSNSSLIGVRGRYQAHPAIAVTWQAETTIPFDGQGGDLVDRDTFIGLTGDWGLLRAGKFDTPLKTLRNRVDLFGNQVGDIRNISRNRVSGTVGQNLTVSPGANPGDPATTVSSSISRNIGFDERFRNSIHYRTPDFGGITGDVQYATSQADSGNATSDNDAWSASLTYRTEKLYLAIAHEQQNFAAVSGGFDDFERKATRIAAAWDIGDLRITGFYQEATDPDDKAYGLGLRYRLTQSVALKGQFYRLDADADNSGSDLFAVGVDYQLDRNLQFYLNYARVDNDNGARLSPYAQGRSANPSVAQGDDPGAVSLGAIYRF